MSIVEAKPAALSIAMALATELLEVARGQREVLATGDDDRLALLMALRGGLISRLAGACTATMLGKAAPTDRARLVAIFGEVADEDARFAKELNAARTRSADELFRTAPIAAASLTSPPRFLDRTG